MIRPHHLSEYIIKPVLRDLIMYSDSAAELLLFTAVIESNAGSYLKNINGGYGIYLMDRQSYADIWANYIPNKQNLLTILTHQFDVTRMPDENRLIHDLRFATAMCAIHYQKSPEIIPQFISKDQLWDFYKKYYNSTKNLIPKDRSLDKYHMYISASNN
jgi:hypothetical protein